MMLTVGFAFGRKTALANARLSKTKAMVIALFIFLTLLKYNYRKSSGFKNLSQKSIFTDSSKNSCNI